MALGGFVTSVGGGLWFGSSLTTRCAALASIVAAVAIFFSAPAQAQVSVGDATVSQLAVSKTSIAFSKIDLSSTNLTQTKSFTITDGGGLALSVTVAPPTGSPFFKITLGQGTPLIQPHGTATVRVQFAPTNRGTGFSASIAISTNATAGTKSAKVKLTGSAKGSLPAMPTATATPTASPTHTATATSTPTAASTATMVATSTRTATPTSTTLATSTATSTSTPTATATATSTVPTDVLTYHNDNARTGQNLTEQILTTANVKTSFGKLFEDSVDGLVDAQPLIKTQVAIPGQGTRNVIYVVTENDSVYAFDADTSGPALWHVSVLGTGEAPSDDRGCGQVTPKIGITSTPVIDPASGAHGTIYVVAMSKNTTTGAYFQRIHALDITTGAEEFSGPVTVTATYPPGPAFAAKQYKERTGLLLLDGQLITAWASHCDIGAYNGWIMAYDQNTLAQTSVLDVTPNGGEGAIWQSGGGLAADSASNIYLLDGNGTWDTTVSANGFPTKADFGNAFLKLSTSGGLQVEDFFEPFNTVSESAGDTDLGSGGAMVLPDMIDKNGVTRHLAVGAGKDGNIYLVDRDNMGKWNSANNNNAYQVIAGGLNNGEWAMPAYFNGTVYYGGVNESLQAFTLSQARLVAMPSSSSTEAYGYPGATPSISANGSSNAILWAVQNQGSLGVLRAYDATNLGTELYNR